MERSGLGPRQGTIVWSIQAHAKQRQRRGVRTRRPSHRHGRQRSNGQGLGQHYRPRARCLQRAATGVQDLAFSPDRHVIASVGGTYHGPVAAEVKVWSSRTGEQTASYQGHTSLVTAVAFFPDGRRLATASDDRTIKLWDVYTGEEVSHSAATPAELSAWRSAATAARSCRGALITRPRPGARWWPPTRPRPPRSFPCDCAAVERVQSLFARHLLKSEVLQVLRTDQTVSPGLRAAALEIAERRVENASALYEAAWLTIVRPTGQPDDYGLAVRRLEAACQVVTEDPVRLADYRRALALALDRAGQPAKALETIKSLGHLIAPTALELAVTAMASAQLGHTREARDALDQLQKLVQTARYVNDQESLGFLREADAS